MDGYQWGGVMIQEKVQGIRSTNGRYNIDRGRLRKYRKWREAKELIYTTHGHELRWGNAVGRGSAGQSGTKGRKNGTTVIAQSIKYTF